MPSTGPPSKRTEPCSFCRVPQMQLTSVLLPEPFGPISPSRSPFATESEIFSSATKPPKRLPRLLISRRLAAAGSVLFMAQFPVRRFRLCGGRQCRPACAASNDEQVQQFHWARESRRQRGLRRRRED